VKSEAETKENVESKLEGAKAKASEAYSATAELQQKEAKLGEMDHGLQSSSQRLADLGESLSTLRRERNEAIASADSNASRVEELVTRIADLEKEIAVEAGKVSPKPSEVLIEEEKVAGNETLIVVLFTIPHFE
jgi:chromosome segregation ATPase